MGGHPVPLCADPTPRVYSALPGADRIAAAPPGTHAGAGGPPAAHIFVDCASRERTGKLQEALSCGGVPGANIDHHPSNTLFGTLNWVDPAYSSTGEMVAHLHDLLGVPFDGAADALYAAVVTDTGSFAYAATRPETHRLAARLLEAGVSPADHHSRLYESRDPAAQLLLGRALASMKFREGGRIAYMVLSPEDFAASGAGGEHTDGIVNHARAVSGAEIGILFFAQAPDQPVRVGIRTRPAVDASALAGRFGGGGHPRASGCRMAGPLDVVVETFLAAAAEALR
jgi:phosphoesterase RecJ-like protein